MKPNGSPRNPEAAVAASQALRERLRADRLERERQVSSSVVLRVKQAMKRRSST